MIKVGSDFSGVGAFDQALMKLEIDYKTVFVCDMDKYARKTFIANYGEPKYYPENVYDREIPSESLDIYMTSPPCQAFSLAGKRKGESDDRGILFYNSHEFIKVNKPRFFIFENVKGLLSDDSGKTFQRWIDFLGGKSVNGNPVLFSHDESVPYHIYWKVLNAKDYGVPQNRERIFIVGIRDDQDNVFSWPKESLLEKRLRDVLESEVDEKYYLSEKMIEGFIGLNQEGIARTIRCGGSGSKDDKHNWDLLKVGYVNQNTQGSSVYSDESISQTLCAGTHGYANGYIEVKSATSKGYEAAEIGEDSINLEHPNSETRRGRVGKGVAQTLTISCNQGIAIGAIRGRNPDNPTSRKSGEPTQQMLEINENGVSNCLTTVQKDNVVIVGNLPGKHEQNSRIYGTNGVSPTLTTMQGGGQEPKVLQINPSKESGGKQPYQQNRIYDSNGISTTLCRDKADINITENYRIRKLTPRECFRLMAFPDSLVENARKAGVSDSQLYKQAGNSIVVDVLSSIINKLNLKQ